MTTESPRALVHLTDSELTVADPADDVRGRTVVDRGDEEVGDVDDLVVDPEERRVRFLQVGSGGFLGIGSTKQLIPVDAVVEVSEDTVRIAIERTQVAAAPAFDPDLIPEPDYYAELYGHYGYPPYWMPGYVYPPFPRMM